MELLAPAGTIQSLKSAVVAGADAVYFGLGELNARAKSIDFTRENVGEWIEYCHLYGVKAYITINVNVYDNELVEAMELVDVARRSKADALILSDLGLICLVRQRYPDINIHVSTQAGVKNKYASEFYKAIGVTRVVLSRESSLNDIACIDGIEKEIFVHGALCVAFSGNCLLSCYIGGKSGNRGQCRQPCRQSYRVYDQNDVQLFEGYALSTKDLCLDDYLKKLELSGVDCLKIEGRLKSPEYVYSVTSYYRKLLDGIDADKKDALISYNRGGFTPAYFEGKNTVYTKTSGHIGLPIGKVLAIENKNGFRFAKVDCRLNKGDGLKILRNGYEVGGSDVTSCKPCGNNYIIPVSNGVKPDDVLCLTRSAELSKTISLKDKKLKVDFYLSFGDKAVLKVRRGNVYAECSDDTLDYTRTLAYNDVFSQMNKTGNTCFELNSLSFEGYGFLPKSKLNALRTSALDLLRKKIIEIYAVHKCENNFLLRIDDNPDKLTGTIVESDRLNVDLDYRTLVFYPKIISQSEYLKAKEFCRINRKNLFIKLPLLIEADELSEYVLFAKKENIGIYADNVSVVWLARKYEVRYIAGVGLNIANKVTASLYKDASAIVDSLELGRNGLGNGDYVYSYGTLPLMHFEHCPNETISGHDCSSCKNPCRTLYYKHVNKFTLLARRTRNRCYYTLYSDKKVDYPDTNETKKYVSLICDNANQTFDGLYGE